MSVSTAGVASEGAVLATPDLAEALVWVELPLASLAVTTTRTNLCASADDSAYVAAVAPVMAVSPVPAASLERYHW